MADTESKTLEQQALDFLKDYRSRGGDIIATPVMLATFVRSVAEEIAQHLEGDVWDDGEVMAGWIRETYCVRCGARRQR
jgi:hypothetical protein